MSEEEAPQVTAGRDSYHATGNMIFQYGDPSLERGALMSCSASEGADLLIELTSGDKPLGPARAALTGVLPSVAAPALRMLLGRDKDLAVALLASIPEATAESLVGAMGAHNAGLKGLLTAIEAINQCESAAAGVIGRRVGRFMRASSRRGTQGFLQTYANGAIHWSPIYGALATTLEIARYHREAGGSDGPLGFPATAATHGEHPVTRSKCEWQQFEGPADYNSEVCDYLETQCGAGVIFSQKYGTHGLWGAIGECSELDWRGRGGMGLPVDDAIAVGPSQRADGAGTSGWRQRFENESVYYSDKTGLNRVPQSWASYLESQGDVAGSTGFPVSPVFQAATSPKHGTNGHFQRFEGPWDYPEDIVGRWSDLERPGGATIYYSDKYGAHTVGRGNGVLYERLNGTASWLGFPTSDEIDCRTLGDAPGRTVQQFEGGAIFYTPEYNSIPVRSDILDYFVGHPVFWNQRGFPTIGFPTSMAESLPGDGNYVQFFEQGVVTVRDNQFRVWLDPAL